MNRLIVAAALLLIAGAASAQEILLQGAQLIDPRSREVRVQNLLLRDGKVVATVESLPTTFAGEVLDLTGRYLLPGLHDLHTHSFGNAGPAGPGEFFGTPGTARRALYAGVVGFLDLFNAEDAILGLRDRQRSDPAQVVGADIFAAGPCMTATGGHCSQFGIPTRLIDSPEDARRQVTELAAKKPDVVKVVYHTGGRRPTVDAETLTAAIETANELGLKTVVHVGGWPEAEVAARAGVTAITHAPDGRAVPIPDTMVQLLKERGTHVIPTLGVYLESGRIAAAPEALEAPLVIGVTSQRLRDMFTENEARERMLARASEEAKAIRLETVRKLAAAGVPILTGTDAGNPGVFQGYSVHREIAWLVEAGLDPWQALAASTTTAGEFLGRPVGFAPGDHASFVVLERNPLDDIENTESVISVIHRGQVVDREALLQ